MGKREVTRNVDYINISDDLMNEMIREKRIQKLEGVFESLYSDIDKLLKERTTDGKWISVENRALYYLAEDSILIPDVKRWTLPYDSFSEKMDGFSGVIMPYHIAEKYFYREKDKNPMVEDDRITYFDQNNCGYCARYIFVSGNNSKTYYFDENCYYNWNVDDSRQIKLPIYQLTHIEKEDAPFFMLYCGLSIFEDSEKNNLLQLINKLLSTKQLTFSEQKFHLDKVEENEVKKIIDGEVEQFHNVSFKKEDVVKEMLSKDNICSEKMYLKLTQWLLECDYRRVNMEKYSKKILQDPESGHWDLWVEPDKNKSTYLGKSLVARNPVEDALKNKSGVIGIDFGTKSTVVTYRRSRADILPMRVGSGKYKRTVSKEDYENPTVMEVRNVQKFLRNYNEKKGRPETCWEDLLISHEAAEQLKSEQSKEDSFATFFSELKQWASDKERRVKLRDLQGYEISLPPYLELSGEDFDPIEIYAYYLGLYINNMVQKIFLRYKLSFPATVEKEVRNKILKSFEKGLKKSLPNPVLEDEECQKLFKVEQGASEPAAYAICALQAYGFDPEDGEKYYYSIFDFGGGTTDFDFGVWSCEEKEPENYDYQISHFGEGGDPFLGGENLLEYLAYHVYMKNSQHLKQENIVFTRPHGAPEFMGHEVLVKNQSQVAHLNTRRLMEKLRGVWERRANVIEEFSNGTISVTLLKEDGTMFPNCRLDVDIEELERILEDHIDSGMQQFFNAMKESFGPEFLNETGDVEKIHIFLAGNSSKSPLVTKILKRYIDEMTEGIAQKDEKNEQMQYFCVYPPLGTKQADKIQKGEMHPTIEDIIKDQEAEEKENLAENSSEKSEQSIENEDKKDNSSESDKEKGEQEKVEELLASIKKPTGKTGVAFGLLDNRVRVIHRQEDEIRFKYYLGLNRKKKFYCVMDRNQKYGMWKRFCTASVEEFDIWYTQLPKATTNNMPITDLGIYSEPGFIEEPDEEKGVYIRFVEPTVLEYVVASEEEMEKNAFDETSVTRITLQEKA